MADKCTLELTPGDWDNTLHQATTTFKVYATRDFKEDGDKVTVVDFDPLHSADVPPIFNNYHLPDLQVEN